MTSVLQFASLWNVKSISTKQRSESFQQFQARVLLAIENVAVEVIYRTIMSMPKRIQAILDSKGETEQNITTA